MIHKFLKIFFLLSLILVVSCKSDPCFTKDQFVESYTSFFKEMSEVSDFSDNEAKENYLRYKSLVNDCYKKYASDLKLSEKQEFWKKSFYSFIKNQNQTIKDEFKSDKEFNKYVMEEISKVIETSGSDISNALLKTLSDEFPKLLENLSLEIENFGQKLLEELLDEN